MVVQFVSVSKTILDVIFFLQVCSSLKLCCTSGKKGIKGKEKAIFYAVSSHRFAHSMRKKNDLLTLVVR